MHTLRYGPHSVPEKRERMIPPKANRDETPLADYPRPDASSSIRRVALLVESSSSSFAAAGLRELTPTAVVRNLEELRQAHIAHHEGTLTKSGSAPDTYSNLIAFDMTTFDTTEISLLGSYLSITHEIGVVYIFTHDQFETCNPSAFDVVIG